MAHFAVVGVGQTDNVQNVLLRVRFKVVLGAAAADLQWLWSRGGR